MNREGSSVATEIETVSGMIGAGGSRTEFDPKVHPASEAVVSAVAGATGRDVLTLPLLFSVIDTDALNAICTHGYGRDNDLTVRFAYAGCRVTVDPAGTILVESPDGESEG